jgi:hypothetical protein
MGSTRRLANASDAHTALSLGSTQTPTACGRLLSLEDAIAFASVVLGAFFFSIGQFILVELQNTRGPLLCRAVDGQWTLENGFK